MLKVAAVVLLAALAGCAAQEPLLYPTSSGHPEGTFENSTLQDAQGKLSAACAQNGVMVIQSTENQVVCGQQMTGGQAIFAQTLIGNSYSTPPMRKVRFTLYKQGSGVRVIAYEWIETQMAFGQVRTQELNSNNQMNSVQSMLFRAGAKM